MNLTVLITTYNSSKYLGTTLRTVFNQTYNEFQLLIVDDGSTDNTLDVINKFNDSRIQILQIDHKGFSAALNFGLENSYGDWIARLDSDDLWHADKLKYQVSLNGICSNDIIVTKGAYFRGNKILFTESIESDQADILRRMALYPNFLHSSALYNKEFILGHGGYNLNSNSAEDYDLWLRIKDDANFRVVDKYLVFYRIHQKSLSRTDRGITRGIIYSIQSKYYNDLEKEFKIENPSKQLSVRGWREYFFGNKENARKFWNLKIFIKYPRTIIAFLITYLPNSIFAAIRELAIRPRLRYLFHEKLLRKTKIDKEFQRIIETNHSSMNK